MKWWVICMFYYMIVEECHMAGVLFLSSEWFKPGDTLLCYGCRDLLQDRGDEFTYTGSGGRDLSGNKRIGEHSFDQTLTHMNRYDS